MMIFLFCSFECTLMYFNKQSIFCPALNSSSNWQFVQNQKSQSVHNQFQCFHCDCVKVFNAQSDLLVSYIYNLRHTVSKFIFVLHLYEYPWNLVSRKMKHTIDCESIQSCTLKKNLKRSFYVMSRST